MEGVGRIGAADRRVAQRLDDLHHLGDRSGPAVKNEKRQGVRMIGTGVDEMDLLAIDVGGGVGPGVESSLGGPPVEPAGPVFAKLPEVAQIGAVVPAGAHDLIGPPGTGQPFSQVVQNRLGYGYDEGLNHDVAIQRSGRGVLQRQAPPRPGPVGHVALRGLAQVVLG